MAAPAGVASGLVLSWSTCLREGADRGTQLSGPPVGMRCGAVVLFMVPGPSGGWNRALGS